MVQNKARCVLITRFSAIGDVAMTIPVIYAAAESYPHIRFVLVTRSRLASLFVNAPKNLTVDGIDIDSEEYKGVFGLKRLSENLLKKYCFDTYIDLHRVLRTQIISFFLKLRGVKVFIINKGHSEKHSITRNRNKQLRRLPSQFTRYSDVFSAAGLPVDVSSFKGIFPGRSSAPASLFASVCPPKPDGCRWIAIAPFAAHTGKIYPPQLMKKVIEGLVGLSSVKIFLFGGGEHEQHILERWADELPGVISLAGKRLGFPAELALLNHCDVAVTMDSANMHLAALAGIPVITIWGATHPYTGFAGWKTDEKNYIQLPMPCRPCSTFGNRACGRGDYHCLAAIPPSQIIAKVKSLLA